MRNDNFGSPAWVTTLSVSSSSVFIQWPYIYYINGNVIIKYDIVTWATIDASYYWTRKWVYNNWVRTNINTTWDLHAIFKPFSN